MSIKDDVPGRQNCDRVDQSSLGSSKIISKYHLKSRNHARLIQISLSEQRGKSQMYYFLLLRQGWAISITEVIVSTTHSIPNSCETKEPPKSTTPKSTCYCFKKAVFQSISKTFTHSTGCAECRVFITSRKYRSSAPGNVHPRQGKKDRRR